VAATLGGDPVSTDPLERLHALLLAAVRRRGGEPQRAPVTVAEIYQDLVPYRSVRGALGLEMNADYEHTVLRLLSGEAGLARIEPAAAREQMQHELESPNPNVALYRKFAGCDVWLAPAPGGAEPPAWVLEHLAGTAESAPAAPEPPPEAPPAPAASGVDDVAAPAQPVTAVTTGAERAPTQKEHAQPMTSNPAGPAGVAPEAAVPPQPEPRPVAAVAAHCAFCDSELPGQRRVRFCPFCGQDQSRRPCAVCGEALHLDWLYCIACGEPSGVAET
jgi:hypothetical protein